MNRLAVEGLQPNAGAFRNGPISIEHSVHQPPHWQDVPREIDDMCDYINDEWANKSPIAENKDPYYEALDAADAAWREQSKVDVGEMEKLLATELAAQLVAVYNNATEPP